MIFAGNKVPFDINPSALKIAGMDPVTFILVCGAVLIFALILLYYMRDSYMRKKYMADINNYDKDGVAHPKVLCEFTDDTGGPVERLLCESYKGQAKKIENQSRATFTIDLFAKAPEGHSIDDYYLIPEHNHLDYYPYGKPKSQQILVQKFYFTKNDPCPKIPHDPSKWDSDRYDRVTSAMARLARNESSLQVLVSEISGVWKDIETFLKYLRQITMIKYLQFGTIALVAIDLLLDWSNSGAISTVAKFLTGK